LLGLVGAHEWRKKGLAIPALSLPPSSNPAARIYPHYGVFSPVRQEYVQLVADAAKDWARRATPAQKQLAFDIGTGTGVLAAVLAMHAIEKVVATELEPRALACAQENIAQLGFSEQVNVASADLFPVGRAPLIVCNPPWLPGKPHSRLEYAVYDPENRMLRGFLAGVLQHLTPQGEAWLILSDLAEHLGLRTRDELMGWIEKAGLQVISKSEAKPAHRKALDANDPLHAARAAEVVTLWKLSAA
jgi:methylase of polypeptide subunit release factors